MPELTEIQKDLQALAAGLKQLEVEYNMFFSGRAKRPPWETRNRVAALVKKWDRGYIQSAADRFQFDTLQRRFQTFVDLWDRGLRAREEGRPGPFVHHHPSHAEAKKKEPDQKVVHVAQFQDPMREMDKLHTLYDFPYFSRASLYQPLKFANRLDEAAQMRLPQAQASPLEVGRPIFHTTARGWERDL